jgi:hypothetical protein
VSGLWIAALLITFLTGAILVLTELYEARRALESPPIDIDRYTRTTRAREVQADDVRESYRRLGLSREEKTKH